MPSVGSLTVEIAADIAKLRSGVEETQTRLAGLERTTAKTGQNMQRSFEASIAGINAAWIKMGVVAATAMKAWDFAEQATKLEQQKASFANLAASYGTNGDKIIAELKSVSEGTIGTMALVEKAGTAMMMGIDPEKVSKLMEIARSTSKMTGQTVSKAFEDIALAVGRQSKMILDNLGIIVSVEDANKKYAASLGKTSTALSDAEKKTAFLTATIQAGEDLMRRMGEQSDTTADKMERFKAQTDNLKLSIGGGFVSAGLAAVGVFQWLAAGAMQAYASIQKMMIPLGALSDWTGRTKGQAAYNRQQADYAAGAAAEMAGKAAENFKLAFGKIEIPAVKVGPMSGIVEDADTQNKALLKIDKEYEKEQKLIYDQLVKDAEEQANALRQIKEISAEDNRKIDEMEMERAEAWADQRIQVYQDMVERIADLNQQISSAQSGMDKDAISKGLEGTNIASPLMGLMDSMNGEDAFQEQMDRIEEQYAVQLELLQEYQDTRFSMEEGFVTQREQMERLAAQRQLAIDRLTRQQRISMAQDTFGTLAGVAQAFYAASDNQNKAALNAYKAFAIAETLIATYSSAQKLFDFGAKFGPWTAAAFAAIGIAAGMARVHQIASIHANTSSVSAGAGSGVSVGEGGASTSQAAETATDTTEATSRPQTINIYVQGNIIDQDKFARDLVPSLRKAFEDNA
jgi:hypothetical protein